MKQKKHLMLKILGVTLIFGGVSGCNSILDDQQHATKEFYWAGASDITIVDSYDEKTQEVTGEIIFDVSVNTIAPQLPSFDTTISDEMNTSPGIEEKNDKLLGFAPVLSATSGFYSEAFFLEMSCEIGMQIYYTLDGSEPTLNSNRYDAPLLIEAKNGNNPDATIVKAKTFSIDGTGSETIVRTYFTAAKINERFSTTVLSIIGTPEDFFDNVNGIFYGSNYELHGAESERMMHIEAWDSDSKLIFSQYAGLRIYGGTSRGNSIKSLKIYARKKYEAEKGKFKTDVFQTPKINGKGVVNKYDNLILRNGGNDFQYAFLRDELNQRLAKDAGFTDYEAVVPAVVYLNGTYYGLLWLHESYCDEYFKNKYGKNSDTNGEFVVFEGREATLFDEDDEEKKEICNEFNTTYIKFASKDLRKKQNYEELCNWIDVENYLDFFAYNLYINNVDWPQNNYKCYRYFPADGETFGEGVYDGRWRFLIHDTDYSMNIYGYDEVMHDYNSIKAVLDIESCRYAPLFVALMKRNESREYFRNKVLALSNGALSEANILRNLDELLSERKTEMPFYYEHLAKLKKNGDHSIVARPEKEEQYLDEIRLFAKKRAEYMELFLNVSLP